MTTVPVSEPRFRMMTNDTVADALAFQKRDVRFYRGLAKKIRDWPCADGMSARRDNAAAGFDHLADLFKHHVYRPARVPEPEGYVPTVPRGYEERTLTGSVALMCAER